MNVEKTYLTSNLSSNAINIPGMTTSPSPSMAKLSAASPFSSKSCGNTTGEEAERQCTQRLQMRTIKKTIQKSRAADAILAVLEVTRHKISVDQPFVHNLHAQKGMNYYKFQSTKNCRNTCDFMEVFLQSLHHLYNKYECQSVRLFQLKRDNSNFQ